MYLIQNHVWCAIVKKVQLIQTIILVAAVHWQTDEPFKPPQDIVITMHIKIKVVRTAYYFADYHKMNDFYYSLYNITFD